MINRMLRMALVCTAAAAITIGCGDDDPKPNNTTTSGNNTTTGPNNTTTGPNNTTTGPNNVTTPDEQCSSVGEECVVGDPTDDNFVCVDVGDGPKCRATCVQPQTPEDPKGCPAGSVCVGDENTQQTFCQQSQCSGWDDATSCDAFFPDNGGNCFPDELFFEGEAADLLPNDAFFCAQSNGAAVGETCMALNDCAPGLFCDGTSETCQTICTGDAECTGDDRCVGDDTARFLDNGVGVCQLGCDAFSTGQCPDGQGCVTISETDGACVPVGTGTLGDQCQIGTAMMPVDPQCEEGLQCVNFGETDNGGNTVGRCVATCSTLGINQEAWNATCPSADQNAFGRFVHLDETKPAIDIYVNDMRVVDDLAFGDTSMGGMFAQLPTGQLTVDIVTGTDADNMNPLETVTPTLLANDALTWGVTPDGTDIQVISIDVPRNVTAPAAGSAKLRVGHGIPDVTPVDVVAVAADATDFSAEVVLATNLDFGTAGSFIEVPGAADYDIYVFTAGTARSIGAEAALFENVTVPADATFTVYARGSVANANLGLTIVDYVSASVSSALPQFCFELADDPSPTGGVCFDTCTADQYGQGVCSISDFQCTPLGGGISEHLCFPGGDVAVGGACDPEVGNCNELGTCQARGDGTGICVSHCQPGTQTNAALTCEAGQSCNQAAFSDAFNFGRCGNSCTPTDGLKDLTCPANLQTCFVRDSDREDYFCSASGPTAAGATCDVVTAAGALAPNTCEPGHLCGNPLRLLGDNMTDIADPGTCTQICELVSDEASACAAGTKCGIDWLQAGTGLGFCVDPGANPADGAQGDPCTVQGAPCGDGSVCLNAGAGLACLNWCDRSGMESSCPAGSTCRDIFQVGTALDIGACI